jgi:hypothetical protein
MARKFLTKIDMTHLEILNLRIHQIAGDLGSPLEGELWYNSSTHLMKWYNGTGTIDPLARANHSGTQLAATVSDLASTVQAYRLDQFAVPTADINLNTHKLTNVVDPTGAQDAATKNYVDGVVQGFSWKQLPVRVATTAAGTLTTSFVNGSTIDGVALVTGDRILIKNQAAGTENGIYTVNASGAPTRAVDADTGAELVNATVWVSQGTTQSDTAWTQTANAPITIGTTALVFAQVGGGSSYSAGNGLQLVGSVFSVLPDPTPADLVATGTGLKTDATKVAHIYTRATIGDGAATSIVVTHNLGTKMVIAEVWDNGGTFDRVECDVQHTSTTTITLIFATAPATNAYSVVVHG